MDTAPPTPDAIHLTAPHWGQSRLAHAFDLARQNQMAGFVHCRAEWALLEAWDVTWNEALDAIGSHVSDALSAFNMRAHCSWQMASMLATAGNLPDSHVLMRAVLECAVYGAALDADTEMMKAWAQRSESADNRRTARRLLKLATMLDEIRIRTPELADELANLLDFAIDSGAHPNPGSIGPMWNEVIVEQKRTITFQSSIGDPIIVARLMRTISQTASTSLRLLLSRAFSPLAALKLDARISELTIATAQLPLA